MIKPFWSTLKALWCRLFHGAPMWPIHGYYRCSTCLRKHPVPWACHEERPEHDGVPAAAHSASMEVNGFVPQMAYADEGTRKSL